MLKQSYCYQIHVLLRKCACDMQNEWWSKVSSELAPILDCFDHEMDFAAQE